MTMTIHNSIRPTFLIIDDDPVAIKLMNEVLQKEGDVLFATNGADGLRQARNYHPDLILLDAEMPGMNGFEVCSALQLDPATARIPIIFVTVLNDIQHEIKALNTGAIGFIRKPICPLIIELRVKAQLRLKQQADPYRLI